jgi:hypothetical protein
MEDGGWRACKNVFKKQFEKAVRNDAPAFDSNTMSSYRDLLLRTD